MQRLDKFLSQAGVGSRKEVKNLIRSGAVWVNGTAASGGDMKIDETRDGVTVNGAPVMGYRRVVLMLHKPAGYVTSTEDPRSATVMELLPEQYRHLRPAPVGRLDKQTEGLLLLTNDGALAHRLISPRYEVPKRYYAEHEGTATEADVSAFAGGLTLSDGTQCRPAVLKPLGAGKSMVTVTEGKYHQVRRMLASRGLPVTYLRREQEGSLCLSGLARGACRELTQQEISAL